MNKRAMNTVDYDVTIVGAGMVGATLAALLRSGGLAVLLIDIKAPPAFPSAAHDLRVSAVNVAAQTVFEKLGAFETMRSLRISPLRSMCVWDESGTGYTSFNAADVGEPHLGHIIENNVVTRALIDVLDDAPNIETRWPARISGISIAASHAVVDLEDGASFTTRLIVGADGARSQIRQMAEIAAPTVDYQQRTLVGIARTEKPHMDCAWQRFLRTGPLAFLPLSDGLCSIAWHADDDFAAQLAQMDKNALQTLIEEKSEGKLGSIELIGPTGGFKLVRMHAQPYYSERVVLIGDAAHAIHPLAGLGANIGFMDAAALAQLLSQYPGRDPADIRTLRRYDRWRRGPNSAIVSVTDGFKHVFGSAASPIEGLRNLGMQIAHRANPPKRVVIRYAMGVDGDLPEMARR